MTTQATYQRTQARPAKAATANVSAFVKSTRVVSGDVKRLLQGPAFDATETRLIMQRLDALEMGLSALRAKVAPKAQKSDHRPSTKNLAAPPAAPRSELFKNTESMVEHGSLVDPVVFQALMGWTTRQAVWKAVASRRVFFVEYQADRYLPAFYADPAYQRSRLEAVTKILDDLPGSSKLQFFLTPKGSLSGRTPLQALAAGAFEKVKSTALAFAER